jgi:hypothetical protein
MDRVHAVELGSALFDLSFLYQQDRNSVANRIHTVASCALERILSSAQYQRLMAFRTDKYFQQFRRNHYGFFSPSPPLAWVPFGTFNRTSCDPFGD